PSVILVEGKNPSDAGDRPESRDERSAEIHSLRRCSAFFGTGEPICIGKHAAGVSVDLPKGGQRGRRAGSDAGSVHQGVAAAGSAKGPGKGCALALADRN